jgi:hypothetical protein
LLQEKKEAKKDSKKVRKQYFALVDLMEDFDLDDEHQQKVLDAFGDAFAGLNFKTGISHLTANV